jgi:hypothetical protein
MRRASIVVSLLLVIPLLVPAAAAADEAQIQGFGGFTIRGSSTEPVFGGSVAVPLLDNVHIIAEGGRFNNIISPELAALVDLTPVDVRLSAFYGDVGVRIIGSSKHAVRPYVEGSVGLAHLYVHVKGAGSDYDPFINAGLQLVDGTHRLFGIGAGVLLQGGPAFLDLGYRHHKIQSGNVIETVLSGGDLDVDQVRVGVGIRF